MEKGQTAGVSSDVKGLLASLSENCKDAKRKHFSDIILSNRHKPRVLFNTIDFLLYAPQTACMEASPAVCENFLLFFIDKVSLIQAQISPFCPQSLSPALQSLTSLSL